MDIVRVFTDAGLEQGVTINIQGTPEEPLFQANQLGELLDIVAIRSTIRDFDDDEKAVRTTNTSGGEQSTTFMTELGLYRLLGMSREPIVRSFQTWVAKVVKEIRLTDKNEMEQRLATATEEHQRTIAMRTDEHEVALEASRRQLEEQAALVAAREAELAKIRAKVYEEVPRLDHVYINKEVAELTGDAHKVGKAVDTKKREAQLNTGSAQGSRMIYKRATVNAKIVEEIVKVVQRRYHIASLGGVEHYSNTVEHTVDVIDIAATVIDTLASSYEYMSRRDLLDKVVANLKALEGDEDGDEGDDEGGGGEMDDNVAAVAGFKAARLARTRVQRNYVSLNDVYSEYCAYCIEAGKIAVSKVELKRELLATMGKFSPPLNGRRNIWRGWELAVATLR